MRAIILAAGPGTRLLPLTETMPKCLLEVQGRSIIDHQLDVLTSCEITDIGVVVGHAKDMLCAHLKKRDDINVTFIENNEYRSSNSAHSLLLAREYLEADPDGFLVLNSDLIFTRGLLAALLAAPTSDGIVISREVTGSDMVNVKLNGNQIVTMSKELPAHEAQAEAVGPIRFSKDGGSQFLERLTNERNNWVFYVLSSFAQEYPFYGVDAGEHKWSEIDTPEDLEVARKIFS